MSIRRYGILFGAVLSVWLIGLPAFASSSCKWEKAEYVSENGDYRFHVDMDDLVRRGWTKYAFIKSLRTGKSIKLVLDVGPSERIFAYRIGGKGSTDVIFMQDARHINRNFPKTGESAAESIIFVDLLGLLYPVEDRLKPEQQVFMLKSCSK
ncbi:hypothetical protein AD948_00970 [Acetobacter senegalensis]|uniref:Uncharacterized protein n=1 Tax=Acetobacter senegalensis TaxID=446692 RepID=A0A149U884_9PROT|nr:hypothetical protein [Acetobacter senegalensis]KXV61638.1 hypothetical protein AD948_00970 [Acetobacter senegalensis]